MASPSPAPVSTSTMLRLISKLKRLNDRLETSLASQSALLQALDDVLLQVVRRPLAAYLTDESRLEPEALVRDLQVHAVQVEQLTGVAEEFRLRAEAAELQVEQLKSRVSELETSLSHASSRVSQLEVEVVTRSSRATALIAEKDAHIAQLKSSREEGVELELWRTQEVALKSYIRELQWQLESVSSPFARATLIKFMASGSSREREASGRVLAAMFKFSEAEAREAGVKLIQPNLKQTAAAAAAAGGRYVMTLNPDGMVTHVASASGSASGSASAGDRAAVRPRRIEGIDALEPA